MEGLVVEVEVSTGLHHVAHDATQAQAGATLLLFALRAQLPVSRLYALLLHRQRPVDLQFTKKKKYIKNIFRETNLVALQGKNTEIRRS